MSNAMVHFQLERGDLKLPECIAAAHRALQSLAPLDVIRSATSPGFWTTAARSIPDLVLKMVNINVADVLVGAWKTHRTLKKYTDPDQYPSDVPAVVKLLSHEVSATAEPFIEILVDGQPQGRIEFELELAVELEVGHLIILNRRIMRMEGGAARATGTLRCSGIVISEVTTRDFAWRDGIDFGEGIEIVPDP